ncbi:alpha/beta hydrolase [Burkholderia sp. THE68]|uniref:alpha/beta fold hydrolase n=1 Tax=Burkholderia sp. THE68 TaxID=758782 RepID=UPI00138A4B08|nr:alpha/beta hydrolase [Burkholderia sp. THE68]
MKVAEDTTVVFAHGAWADGSSWSKLLGPLKANGVNVVCAPLPLRSLQDDVEMVASVVDRSAGPVVLVGHAYAGAVIGAVTHPRVQSLVFVAGLAPDEGETVADVFYRDAKHPDTPELAPDDHGFIWMSTRGFQKAFAQNARTDEKDLCEATQRPISVRCIQEKVGTPTWKSTPSWYLVAEQDRMINPDTQRFMADRMNARIRVENVDHTPSITAPEVVLEVVWEAVKHGLSKADA